MNDMNEKKRKPPIILLAAICVVIIAVIIAVALIVQKNSWKTGGEGSKSPYKWKEEEKLLTLSFDTSKLDGGEWQVKGNDDRFFSIEQESEKKREIFNIKGKYTGTAILEIFYMQKEEEVYHMMAEIDVSNNGITMKREAVIDTPEKQTGGEDTQNPFTYKAGNDGVVTVSVSNIEEHDWNYTDNIPFYVEGQGIKDSVLTVTIRNGEMRDPLYQEEGRTPMPQMEEKTKADFKIFNSRLGAEIIISLEVNSQGGLEVTSVSAKGPSKEELENLRG